MRTAAAADTLLGPAFRLVNTVVVPHPLGTATVTSAARLEVGDTRRGFFVADSARPFLVRVATASPLEQALAALYEPGGRPFRDRPPPREQEIGADSAAAVFQVDARDAQRGVYEIDAFSLASGATVSMRVEQAPFRFGAGQDAAGPVAQLTNVSGKPADADVAYALVGGERAQAIDTKGSDVVRIPLTAPSWVRGVVVDVEMEPAQWGRFTDFGVSLFDPVGRVLAKEPMNYAVSRLKAELPAQHGDLPLEVRLFPGFADPGPHQEWKAVVTVRLYNDRPAVLESQGRRTVPIAAGPGQSKSVHFALTPPGWALPEGFQPLGVIVAHSAGEPWTREAALRPTAGP
jgi:hypothetical protein